MTHIDAEVVLASSSGWAHGVRTKGRLIVYCHAPARWLYQSDRYLRESAHGGVANVASASLNPFLRHWDQRAAKRVDRYVANSSHTANLIREIYGINADVVAPPVRPAPAHIAAAPSVDVLIVARLLPYKNVDLALAAAALTPEISYRVVGDGPLATELRARAGTNVQFTGAVGDDELWSHYASASLHLALSHEDFGITPLEAAMVGVPTVARRSGGYLDTITASTGQLIDEAQISPAVVADTVREALATTFDRELLRTHAALYSPERHMAGIRAAMAS
jgi:glycosyltransferase involved in cell wall biosynthesis